MSVTVDRDIPHAYIKATRTIVKRDNHKDTHRQTQTNGQTVTWTEAEGGGKNI